MSLRIALLFNLRPQEAPPPDAPPDVHAELDDEQTVLAIADALRQGGHQVTLLEATPDIFSWLPKQRIDLVFNITEGLQGSCREAQVPAFLEMLGIPFTGASALTLALTLDKPTAKKVFTYHGVATPRFFTVPPGQSVQQAWRAAASRWRAAPDTPADDLPFPLFVKPAREGSSIGITPASVVYDEAALVDRVAGVHTRYGQAALVEEFLPGREFTVGIVGNGDPLAFPILEINYDAIPPGHGPVYSYQFKQEWDDDQLYLCPAPVEPTLADALREAALAAFRVTRCRDVARVDLRLDAAGVPHVLEINPIPGLVPDFSDLPRMAKAAGWSYAALVNRIVAEAAARAGLGTVAEFTLPAAQEAP